MTKIIQRHDTAANWTSVNPVLSAGEIGVETDTNKFKFGDGVTAWSNLAYAAGEGGGGSGTTITSTDGTTTYSKLALGDTLSVTDTSSKELNGVTQTGGTLNSELEFTGASGASLKMTEKYSLSTADSWEFQIKYKHNGGGNNPCIFGYASRSDNKTPCFILEGGSFKFFLSSNGSSWNINSSGSGLTPQTGTIYYFKVGFSGSQYYVKYNTTGWSDEFTTQWTLNSTIKVYCSDYFMLMNLSLNSNYYNTGTMYLQDTALIVNGSEVWRGANIISGPLTLNANIDELGNEVNTLASAVSANEADIAELKGNVINKNKVVAPLVVKKLPTSSAIQYSPNYAEDNNGYISVGSVSVTGQFINSSDSALVIEFDFVLPGRNNPTNTDLFKLTSSDNSSYIFWKGDHQLILTKDGNQSISLLNLFRDYRVPDGTLCHLKADLRFSITAGSFTTSSNVLITTISDGTVVKNYSSATINGSGMTGINLSSFTKLSVNKFIKPSSVRVTSFGNPDIFSIDTTEYLQLNYDTNKIKVVDENLTIIDTPATTSSLGVVQPDGTSITVSETGVISGQDVKTFQGYSDTGTLVLKSMNGVLQWVAE